MRGSSENHCKLLIDCSAESRFPATLRLFPQPKAPRPVRARQPCGSALQVEDMMSCHFHLLVVLAADGMASRAKIPSLPLGAGRPTMQAWGDPMRLLHRTSISTAPIGMRPERVYSKDEHLIFFAGGRHFSGDCCGHKTCPSFDREFRTDNPH
jgi:hypothetical protein